MRNKMRAQDVNQELVRLNLGILLGHGSEALVPERHGEYDPIGLGRRSDMILARPGQLKRVLHDAITTVPGEYVFLDRHLEIAVPMQPSTDLRVLALIVLADD